MSLTKTWNLCSSPPPPPLQLYVGICACCESDLDHTVFLFLINDRNCISVLFLPPAVPPEKDTVDETPGHFNEMAKRSVLLKQEHDFVCVCMGTCVFVCVWLYCFTSAIFIQTVKKLKTFIYSSVCTYTTYDTNIV